MCNFLYVYLVYLGTLGFLYGTLDSVLRCFRNCRGIMMMMMMMIIILMMGVKVVTCPEHWVQSWSQSLATQCFINPVVGCHYFLPGPLLLSQPKRSLLLGHYQIILLDDRGTQVSSTCLRLLHSSAWTGVKPVTARSWIWLPTDSVTMPYHAFSSP